MITIRQFIDEDGEHIVLPLQGDERILGMDFVAIPVAGDHIITHDGVDSFDTWKVVRIDHHPLPNRLKQFEGVEPNVRVVLRHVKRRLVD